MELMQSVAATLRLPGPGEDPPAFTPGEKEEPTEVKVTITRDSDGEEVGEELEAELVEPEKEEEGETYWAVELAGKEIPEVDILTAVWTDGTSTYTTQAEVVGGFVVSVKAIEAHLGEEPASVDIEAKREIATQEIEAACGTAFRPRYRRELVDGDGTTRLILGRRQLLRVLSVEVDEEALSEAELEALTLDPLGALVNSSRWTAGRRNVEVTYVYGYQSFPQAVLPVRDYSAYLLRESPTDWNERATSVSNDLGTYSLVTPGVRGARFPLPSVNAFVNQFAEPLVG